MLGGISRLTINGGFKTMYNYLLTKPLEYLSRDQGFRMLRGCPSRLGDA